MPADEPTRSLRRGVGHHRHGVDANERRPCPSRRGEAQSAVPHPRGGVTRRVRRCRTGPKLDAIQRHRSALTIESALDLSQPPGRKVQRRCTDANGPHHLHLIRPRPRRQGEGSRRRRQPQGAELSSCFPPRHVSERKIASDVEDLATIGCQGLHRRAAVSMTRRMGWARSLLDSGLRGRAASVTCRQRRRRLLGP